MKYNGHLIKSVKENSIAHELELCSGDRLLKINDEIVEDVFDYHYMINDEYIELTVIKENGEEWILEVYKEYDEDLGIEFEQNLMDEYRSCTNKCIFCFIDQMPKGMRETLYFKDDDSRLSFLQGNYITLTNMKDKDIDRIIKYHLCPINISVHTTNKELRCNMLNNRFAGEALDKIKRLSDAGIEMNGQIVLCKNVNDGDELVKSIEDLSMFLPFMRSVSVVPAGITKYREGLYPLELFTKEEAEAVIDTIESYQKQFFNQYGLHFIHASDEFYILAGREFPEEDRYDGYIQLENGVGMMRLMIEEFNEYFDTLQGDERNQTVSIVTGKLAYNMINTFAERLMNKFKNLKVNVYSIRNDFFGENITVSGLITGNDIINQLKDKTLGDRILLPYNIVRSGEEVFLDDVTLSEVATSLNTPCFVTQNGGDNFIKAILADNEQLNEISKKNEDSDNFVYITAYPNRR